jgi:hypothetical protein
MLERFTAKVGAVNAAWLADDTQAGQSGGHDVWRITDNRDGTVTFDTATLNALRALPDHYAGCVETGRLWIEGTGYSVECIGRSLWRARDTTGLLPVR